MSKATLFAIVIVPILAVVLGWLAIQYAHRLDRALEHALDPTVTVTEGDVLAITSRPLEVRAYQAALAYAPRAMAECTYGYRPKSLDGLYNVLGRQSLMGEQGAFIAALAISRCADQRPRAFTRVDGATLAKGIERALREMRRGDNAVRMIAWLEELRPSMSPVVLTAMALAARTSTRALEHFRVGFPPDGAKLVPSSVTAKRVLPEHDPRLVLAVKEAVLQLDPLTPSPAVGAALAELTRIVRVPVSDDVMRSIIRMGGSHAQLEVADNVLTAADVPRLRTLSNDSTKGVVELIAAHFRALDEAEVRAIMMRASNPLTDMNANSDREAIADSARELVALGRATVPIVLEGLTDGSAEVREVAIEALYQLDREHFVDHLLGAARTGAIDGADVQHAVDLAGPNGDPRLQLLALSVPPMARQAYEALKARLPTDELVPLLFTFLEGAREFNEVEIARYQNLLADLPNSVPATADALEAAIRRANNRPADVHWLTKLIALTHLERAGTKKERATVEKLARDASTHGDIRFRELARQTLAAIDERQPHH